MRRNCLVACGLVIAALAACSSDRNDPYTYAHGDIPCRTAADCCVAYDQCKATGLVVGKADLLKVQSLLTQTNAPDSGNTCVRCITPVVEVLCENEKCVGQVVPGDRATLPADLTQDHCGPGNVPPNTTLGAKGVTLSCQ